MQVQELLHYKHFIHLLIDRVRVYEDVWGNWEVDYQTGRLLFVFLKSLFYSQS